MFFNRIIDFFEILSKSIAAIRFIDLYLVWDKIMHLKKVSLIRHPKSAIRTVYCGVHPAQRNTCRSHTLPAMNSKRIYIRPVPFKITSS